MLLTAKGVRYPVETDSRSVHRPAEAIQRLAEDVDRVVDTTMTTGQRLAASATSVGAGTTLDPTRPGRWGQRLVYDTDRRSLMLMHATNAALDRPVDRTPAHNLFLHEHFS